MRRAGHAAVPQRARAAVVDDGQQFGVDRLGLDWLLLDDRLADAAVATGDDRHLALKQARESLAGQGIAADVGHGSEREAAGAPGGSDVEQTLGRGFGAGRGSCRCTESPKIRPGAQARQDDYVVSARLTPDAMTSEQAASAALSSAATPLLTTPRRGLHSERFPRPVASYSQGFQVGQMVFITGQLPVDPASAAALGVLMGRVFHRSSGRGWRLRQQSLALWRQWRCELAARGRPIPWRSGLLLLAADQEDLARQRALLQDPRRRPDDPADGLQLWERPRLRALRPALPAAALAGLYSPADGQLDPLAAMRALADDGAEAGLMFRIPGSFPTCLPAWVGSKKTGL